MRQPEIPLEGSAPPPDRLLASLAGARPPAPAWFTAALAHEPERSFVTAKGAQIETLTWGRRGDPGLLLLHGMGANADWWSFIAPYFAQQFRVTALSWSGMGRSDWRPSYDFATYGEEIFAVAEACGQLDCASHRPIVVGHSYGGVPLMYAAKDRGDELGGAVIIDCYFRPENQPLISTSLPTVRTGRPYASLADALARFRLEPRQGCENLFIVDYIARHSLMQVPASADAPGGWTWRFDPALKAKTRKMAIAPYLTGMPCPLVMMSGDRSNLLTAQVKAYMMQIAPAGTPWVCIPDSDHHVMLDQPLVLEAALSALFAVWPDAVR